MRNLIFATIIFCIILSSCSKNIEDLEYDDSNSFVTVVRWKVTENDKIAHYEFKEGPGVSRLTICWVNTNMRVGAKTENAKMGDIEWGDGYMSFWIKGTKYIYRLE